MTMQTLGAEIIFEREAELCRHYGGPPRWRDPLVDGAHPICQVLRPLEELELGVQLPVLEMFVSGGANLAPELLAGLSRLLEPPKQNTPAPPNKNIPAPIPPRNSMKLNARALKVTLVLDAAELAALPDPATARVMLQIAVAGGRVVTADIASKALRKCKATISESGADNAARIVQGKLTDGNVVVEAGLIGQVKTPPGGRDLKDKRPCSHEQVRLNLLHYGSLRRSNAGNAIDEAMNSSHLTRFRVSRQTVQKQDRADAFGRQLLLPDRLLPMARRHPAQSAPVPLHAGHRSGGVHAPPGGRDAPTIARAATGAPTPLHGRARALVRACVRRRRPT